MNRRLLAATAVLASILAAAVLRSGTSTNDAPASSTSRPPTSAERPTAVRERGPAPPTTDDSPDARQARPSEPREAVRVVVLAAETNAPIAGAFVSIERADGSKTDVTTGADGVAAAGPRLDDDVAMRVSAAGRDSRGYFRSRDGFRRLSWPEPIWLEPGVELRGRVIDAADGSPLAGAKVYARRASFVDDYDFEDRATSAADGTFAFPAVPAARNSAFASWGGVVVSARLAGYAEGSVTPAIVPSSPPTNVVVRLERAARIRGRVVDCDGTPAAGAEISVRFGSRWSDWSSIGTSAVRSIRTDERGGFEIDGVPPGMRIAVLARADDRGASPIAAVVTGADGPSGLVLRLAPLVSVVVRVLDPLDSEIRAASTGLYDEDDSPAVARAEGPSPLRLDRVEPGRLLLCASADGYASGARWIDVTEVPEQTVAISLDAGASLTGVVLDDEGKPACADVTAGTPAEDQGRARLLRKGTRTADDGTFRLDGLPSGELVLDVQGGGLRIVRTVRAADSPLRLVVQRFGSAEGALVVPEGREFPKTCGVYFEAGGPKEPSPPWEGGDDEFHLSGVVSGGRIRVTGLPPGRCAIEVGWPGYRHSQVVIDVQPGATATIPDISLDPGLAVEGRVLDPSGAGVPGVRVESGDEGVGDTDGAGRFRMTELVAGPHLFTVEAPGLAARMRVDVTSATPPVTLVLARTRSARIVVRDARGEVVVGRVVEVIDSERRATTNWIGRWQTDARGVSLRTLLPGRYSVRVEDAAGKQNEATPLEVPPPPPGDDPGVALDVTLR